MKNKEAVKEQVLVRLSETTKNNIRDISNERKKKKAPKNTITDVVEELVNEGLKTITK